MKEHTFFGTKEKKTELEKYNRWPKKINSLLSGEDLENPKVILMPPKKLKNPSTEAEEPPEFEQQVEMVQFQKQRTEPVEKEKRAYTLRQKRNLVPETAIEPNPELLLVENSMAEKTDEEEQPVPKKPKKVYDRKRKVAAGNLMEKENGEEGEPSTKDTLKKRRGRPPKISKIEIENLSETGSEDLPDSVDEPNVVAKPVRRTSSRVAKSKVTGANPPSSLSFDLSLAQSQSKDESDHQTTSTVLLNQSSSIGTPIIDTIKSSAKSSSRQTIEKKPRLVKPSTARKASIDKTDVLPVDISPPALDQHLGDLSNSTRNQNNRVEATFVKLPSIETAFFQNTYPYFDGLLYSPPLLNTINSSSTQDVSGIQVVKSPAKLSECAPSEPSCVEATQKETEHVVVQNVSPSTSGKTPLSLESSTKNNTFQLVLNKSMEVLADSQPKPLQNEQDCFKSVEDKHELEDENAAAYVRKVSPVVVTEMDRSTSFESIVDFEKATPPSEVQSKSIQSDIPEIELMKSPIKLYHCPSSEPSCVESTQQETGPVLVENVSPSTVGKTSLNLEISTRNNKLQLAIFEDSQVLANSQQEPLKNEQDCFKSVGDNYELENETATALSRRVSPVVVDGMDRSDSFESIVDFEKETPPPEVQLNPIQSGIPEVELMKSPTKLSHCPPSEPSCVESTRKEIELVLVENVSPSTVGKTSLDLESSTKKNNFQLAIFEDSQVSANSQPDPLQNEKKCFKFVEDEHELENENASALFWRVSAVDVNGMDRSDSFESIVDVEKVTPSPEVQLKQIQSEQDRVAQNSAPKKLSGVELMYSNMMNSSDKIRKAISQESFDIPTEDELPPANQPEPLPHDNSSFEDVSFESVEDHSLVNDSSPRESDRNSSNGTTNDFDDDLNIKYIENFEVAFAQSKEKIETVGSEKDQLVTLQSNVYEFPMGIMNHSSENLLKLINNEVGTEFNIQSQNQSPPQDEHSVSGGTEEVAILFDDSAIGSTCKEDVSTVIANEVDAKSPLQQENPNERFQDHPCSQQTERNVLPFSIEKILFGTTNNISEKTSEVIGIEVEIESNMQSDNRNRSFQDESSSSGDVDMNALQCGIEKLFIEPTNNNSGDDSETIEIEVGTESNMPSENQNRLLQDGHLGSENGEETAIFTDDNECAVGSTTKEDVSKTITNEVDAELVCQPDIQIGLFQNEQEEVEVNVLQFGLDKLLIATTSDNSQDTSTIRAIEVGTDVQSENWNELQDGHSVSEETEIVAIFSDDDESAIGSNADGIENVSKMIANNELVHNDHPCFGEDEVNVLPMIQSYDDDKSLKERIFATENCEVNTIPSNEQAESSSSEEAEKIVFKSALDDDESLMIRTTNNSMNLTIEVGGESSIQSKFHRDERSGSEETEAIHLHSDDGDEPVIKERVTSSSAEPKPINASIMVPKDSSEVIVNENYDAVDSSSNFEKQDGVHECESSCLQAQEKPINDAESLLEKSSTAPSNAQASEQSTNQQENSSAAKYDAEKCEDSSTSETVCSPSHSSNVSSVDVTEKIDNKTEMVPQFFQAKRFVTQPFRHIAKKYTKPKKKKVKSIRSYEENNAHLEKVEKYYKEHIEKMNEMESIMNQLDSFMKEKKKKKEKKKDFCSKDEKFNEELAKLEKDLSEIENHQKVIADYQQMRMKWHQFTESTINDTIFEELVSYFNNFVFQSMHHDQHFPMGNEAMKTTIKIGLFMNYQFEYWQMHEQFNNIFEAFGQKKLKYSKMKQNGKKADVAHQLNDLLNHNSFDNFYVLRNTYLEHKLFKAKLDRWEEELSGIMKQKLENIADFINETKGKLAL